jgi:hypothetical protein
VTLPSAWQPAKSRPWTAKSLAHVASLPPKKKPVKKK